MDHLLLNGWNWAAIVAFFAVLFGIAVVCSRRAGKDAKDFFLSGAKSDIEFFEFRYKKLTVLVAALFVAAVAVAKEWCIPSPNVVGNSTAVIALTNAVTQAAKDDTITLSNGVYNLKGIVSYTDSTVGPTHLYFSTVNVTLRGDPAEDRENVVLDGGADGSRIAYLEVLNNYNITFANLTFTNAYDASYNGGVFWYGAGGVGDVGLMTNCVVCGNVAQGTTVRSLTIRNCLFENNRTISSYGAGGARVRAYDSVFRNNITGKGGCLNQSSAWRCEFIGNVSSNGTAVASNPYDYVDCMIVSNRSVKSGSGGIAECSFISNCTFLANYTSTDLATATLSANGVIYACRFYNNYTASSGEGALQGVATGPGYAYDCVFSNNVSESGRGVGKNIAVWSNCTFIGNSVRTITQGNAGVSGGTCYHCTFSGHYSTAKTYRNKDATLPVTKTFSDLHYAPVLEAKLIDCDLQDGVSGGSLTRCTIHDTDELPLLVGEGAILTNCLVRNICRKTAEGAYTTCVLFGRNESADPQLVNCTVVSNVAQIFNANPTTVALNTLFYGNLYMDGTTACDISCDNTNHPLLTNCLYQTTGKKPTTNVHNCIQLAANETPKFNARRDGNYPYYMPRRLSKAVGKGAPVDWPEGATDLGGYPRVRDGEIDIGCYESHVVPLGLLMIYR